MNFRETALAKRSIKKGLLSVFSRYIGVCAVMVIIIAIATAFNPVFLSWSNVKSLIVNSCTTGIAAFGMTFVILTGGIDLSAGKFAALVGVFAADLLFKGVSVWAVIPLAILLSAAVGLVVGLIIAKTNIPPFIATLALQYIFNGIAIAYNNGYPIAISMQSPFSQLGNGTIFGINTPIIIIVILFIICLIVLTKTNIGRNVYAVGGNAEAARLSGINTSKTTMFAYAAHFALVGIAGMILASRLYSGLPSSGTNLETNAITAVVIGGTSMSGGDGSIIGTVIGALFMQVLLNVMTLFSFSAALQLVVQGGIILIAVFYDYLRRKKA